MENQLADNTDTCNTCRICQKNNINEQFVSMVHKWREYTGYSKESHPRFFCSSECLETFERDFRCNHCHIIVYECNEYKKGNEGFTYCNSDFNLTIGDVSCFEITQTNKN